MLLAVAKAYAVFYWKRPQLFPAMRKWFFVILICPPGKKKKPSHLSSGNPAGRSFLSGSVVFRAPITRSPAIADQGDNP
jgi:hypothetical protein